MLLSSSSYGMEMDIEIEEEDGGNVKSNINDDESIVDNDDLDDLELYCVCVVLVVAFPALNILPALLNMKNGWLGGGGGMLLLLDDVNTSSTSTRVAVKL